MRSKVRSRVVKAAIAAAATVGLVLGGSVPAQAISNLAIVKVLNYTTVTGYTVFTQSDLSNGTLYVVGAWSNRTTNTARMASFQVCVRGILGNSYVYGRTLLSFHGTVKYNYGIAVKLTNNTCHNYTVPIDMRVFSTNGQDQELIRVIVDVTDLGGSTTEDTVAFFRR